MYILMLLLQLMLAQPSHGFWRMLCGNFKGLHRIDPIVNPGIASPHAHAIHGGSNFGLLTTHTNLLASSCTSCRVKEDNSAYWYVTIITTIRPGSLLNYHERVI